MSCFISLLAEYTAINEYDMKTTKIRLTGFIGLLIVSLNFSSCELVSLEQPPDEPEIFEPTTIPGSITEINAALHGGSSKRWSSVSFTLAGLDGFQECRLDDIIEIKEDGTYSYNGGNTLCGAEDNQQIKTGTWKVIDNGASIVFDESSPREYTATVNGLDENSLSISGQYIGLNIKGIYNSK
jgi:hypothetical protein